MPEIDYREFAARLPKNSERRRLIKAVGAFNQTYSGRGEVRFAKKGSDLVEVIEMFTRQRTTPIVDQKSGFVYGVPEGLHERFRGLLFEYNKPEEARDYGYELGAQYYMMRGCGYYISSMQKGTIVCGVHYQEDRYDKDLFLTFKVFRDKGNYQ